MRVAEVYKEQWLSQRSSPITKLSWSSKHPGATSECCESYLARLARMEKLDLKIGLAVLVDY